MREITVTSQFYAKNSHIFHYLCYLKTIMFSKYSKQLLKKTDTVFLVVLIGKIFTC